MLTFYSQCTQWQRSIHFLCCLSTGGLRGSWSQSQVFTPWTGHHSIDRQTTIHTYRQTAIHTYRQTATQAQYVQTLHRNGSQPRDPRTSLLQDESANHYTTVQSPITNRYCSKQFKTKFKTIISAVKYTGYRAQTCKPCLSLDKKTKDLRECKE